jgi:hypothetical protein
MHDLLLSSSWLLLPLLSAVVAEVAAGKCCAVADGSGEFRGFDQPGLVLLLFRTV